MPVDEQNTQIQFGKPTRPSCLHIADRVARANLFRDRA